MAIRKAYKIFVLLDLEKNEKKLKTIKNILENKYGITKSSFEALKEECKNVTISRELKEILNKLKIENNETSKILNNSTLKKINCIERLLEIDEDTIFSNLSETEIFTNKTLFKEEKMIVIKKRGFYVMPLNSREINFLSKKKLIIERELKEIMITIPEEKIKELFDPKTNLEYLIKEKDKEKEKVVFESFTL